MEYIKRRIEGVVVVEPTIYGDDRGYLFESFRDKEFRERVCDTTFVQENQSRSSRGVVRGLHFQAPPYAQSKLVRVVKGRVLDVVVDIRKGSATYGEYESVELSEENNRQIFIPRGFAHGFVVLEDAIFQYKCDNYYNHASERSILWNDSELAIDWGIDHAMATLSDKDKLSPRFKDFDSPFSIDANYYE
ncbi:MAG: dTDP-4-dehydrorhamnose 3,5-epimerase [Rikenellaceae bacterium]